jgi:lactoylglutathione lyase
MGAGFSRQRLRLDKGAGVEIVFELDGVEQAESLYGACPSRGVVVDPLQDRPWGLRDFRVTDPDGDYLRITHGNAANGRHDPAA